ncbi:MAG: c-type cytochrome [Gammaproteobacteria bacterium]|jgi:cytochrome c553
MRSARQLITTITLILLGISPVTHASSIAAGEAIVMHGNHHGVIACSNCHGPDGNGNVEQGYPALAGLNELYIIKELHEFQVGSRTGAVMDSIANHLSQKDIDNVARYFSTRHRRPNHLHFTSDKLGERLAKLGDAKQHIPACFSCHGEGGHGNGAMFPAIAGQNIAYIRRELDRFRENDRQDDPNGMMRAVAKNLTDDDIGAVADYVASLSATPAKKAASK